jgi:hypothetical protein
LLPFGRVNGGQYLYRGWNFGFPLPFILSPVSTRHRDCQPVFPHSHGTCASTSRNSDQPSMKAEAEKVKVCPKCEDSFSSATHSYHCPPPPHSWSSLLPCLQMGLTFVVWHKAVPGSIHGWLRMVFSWRWAARHKGAGIVPLALATGWQCAQEKACHLTRGSLGLPELGRQHWLFAAEDRRVQREVSIMVGEGQAVGRCVQKVAAF